MAANSDSTFPVNSDSTLPVRDVLRLDRQGKGRVCVSISPLPSHDLLPAPTLTWHQSPVSLDMGISHNLRSSPSWSPDSLHIITWRRVQLHRNFTNLSIKVCRIRCKVFRIDSMVVLQLKSSWNVNRKGRLRLNF